MATNPAPPLCEVECIHADTVDRLAPLVSELAGIGDAMSLLADDTRFKILAALNEAELCVCDASAVTGASKATVSYHLRLLYRSGLVDYRRDGRLVYYRLTDDALRPVLEAASAYARERAEKHPR